MSNAPQTGFHQAAPVIVVQRLEHLRDFDMQHLFNAVDR